MASCWRISGTARSEAPRLAVAARACQRGAAVLVALFVVVLATVLVTDLFWRQFVLFRGVENQQASAQGRLLLHAAQDWARAILQDQAHPTYDALSDPWAQPLAPTRLDQLGETSVLASRASLEGGIQDAQARFNLRNLIDPGGGVNPAQLAALDKLMNLLGAPSGSAQQIAQYLAQSYAAAPPAGAPGSIAGAVPAPAPAGLVPLTSGNRPVPPVLPEDLAAIPGLDPALAQTLAQFVILLDQSNTPINFNTAAPELMAAVVPQLSISDAHAFAAERDRAYFVSVADIQNRLHGRGGSVPAAGVSTNSQYFLIYGTVRLDRVASTLRALVRRAGNGTQTSVAVLWERDR